MTWTAYFFDVLVRVFHFVRIILADPGHGVTSLTEDQAFPEAGVHCENHPAIRGYSGY